ncbi:MAG: DNA-binding protein [Deltaproteobacteria bacterium]|nr:MAG: DNA-binding protein [Deltaproteobacteria bacterium]
MVNLLDERTAAEMLRLSVQTLRNWRTQRRGPAYLKLGRAVRYRPEDLEDYIRARRIELERNNHGS